MSRYSLDFDRRAAANVAKHKAETLDKKGLSDPMWEALQDLHLARLEPQRGREAPMSHPQYAALERRGLATWTPIGETCLWSATETGAKLVKAGRPA